MTPSPGRPKPSAPLTAEQVDFSLVVGGLLYQLFRRAQLSGDALELVPTHPDRVGGLGFLANSAYAFMPLEELLKKLVGIVL